MLIHHYHSTTSEYLGSSDYTPPVGVGIPARSTDIEPPEFGQNQIPVFINGAWSVVSDFRGMTFYKTATRQPVVISELGDVQSDLTQLVPSTEFDVWTDGAWVTDTAAQTRKNIIDQIYALEATITPRRVREAILGIDNDWLSNVESEIDALREQL